MKPILITGADSFSGGILAESLIISGIDVIPMVYQSCGFDNEIVYDFSHSRFSQVLGELPSVSAIVHMGTRTGWHGSTRADLFQPNILATTELVQWAREMSSYFVFVSSAMIAGNDKTSITQETGLDIQSDNDYYYSLWLAEQVIGMSGIRYANLRVSGVFGENGPRNLGLNNAIRDALSGNRPVQYGAGQIKRNYIYVKDLANTIIYCLENEIEGTLLTAGTHINTLAEMLETLCNILLPGEKPEIWNGTDGRDQVIEPSPLLPETRTFEEAIKDIK
jgi:UDP-glucose 4-epimerase